MYFLYQLMHTAILLKSVFNLSLLFFPSVLSTLCPTYPAGSDFQEQAHVYSENGLLDIRLIFQVVTSDTIYLCVCVFLFRLLKSFLLSRQSEVGGNGNVQYCFVTETGVRSPVLHIYPVLGHQSVCFWSPRHH